MLAVGEEPGSMASVIGYILLALAAVAGIAAYRRRRKTSETVELDASQKQEIRRVRNSEGLVPAVQLLRGWFPYLNDAEAEKLVESV